MKKNNPFNRMRKVLILSASFLFMLQACKKDGVLFPDFEEKTTFAFFSDTTSIVTNTRIGDPVLADKISTGLVGEYRDSSFGYTTSSIYIQPVLSSNALEFSDTLETVTVDSVILSLEYGGNSGDTSYYGDTSIAQTFEVFRIDEELNDTTNYYSDVNVAVNSTPLVSHSFTPHPTKPTVICQPNMTDTCILVDDLSAQLRINLGNALGDEIIAKQGSDELANSGNFVKFFKGLKITPVNNPSITDNEAAILYFRLTASNTKMTIYYTVTDTANTITKKAVDFPVNTSSVRFNTFEHDYTGSAAETALQTPNSNFAYVQAMAGMETIIKFPDLKERLGGKIIVNKAELIIPAANGSYTNNVGKADKLIVASRNDSSKLEFIPDALLNSEFFGGDFDVDNNEYKFNISRYVQSYLNGNENDNGLTLIVSGNAVKAERAVIITENNHGNRIRLNLYYTNIQ